METDIEMKNFWKDNWMWIVLIIFWLTIFPFILNQLILSERVWDIVGGPKEWLAFWPSYLSALASAVMIGFTAKALKSNQKQLDELKRQWDEEHKPNVSVSYNYINNVAYLRIVNTSIVEVKDFFMEADFYEGREKNDFFDMTPLENVKINIEPKGVRNIILHYNIRDLSSKYYFILKLHYNGKEQKTLKVFCNEEYSIGDDIIWRKLIDEIRYKK